MDKYEYNLKQDQIKSLCTEENYDAAAEIADTINWNKIKNVNELVRAGEIYEKTGRYEDSKELLLMAYDRSPIGRTIIYRLAELAVKMEDYTAAEEYYDEFVDIAPHDNLKYILKYIIKKAQGASFEELIPILEEFKELEYSEEWAYELAYLYHKAGMSDKCIEACDELILWFGDGPYVERALELKMLYQPLTSQQEEKYRSFGQKRSGVTEIGKEEMKKSGEYVHDSVEIPQVSVNTERFNTVNLQEEIAKGMQQILDATEKETVSDTMDNIKKMVEDIPYLKLPKEESKSDEKEVVHIETDKEIDDSLKVDFQEMIGEDSDGQMSMMVSDRMQLERQITGQMSISEVLEEWEKTKKAAEEVLEIAKQRKLESAKAKALQEAGDIMDRLTDVIPKLDAGISPMQLLKEQYLGEDAEESPILEKKSEIQVTEITEEQQDKNEGFTESAVQSDELKEIGAEEEKSLTRKEEEAGQIFANMNQILGQEIERLSSENAFFDAQLARAALKKLEEEPVIETISFYPEKLREDKPEKTQEFEETKAYEELEKEEFEEELKEDVQAEESEAYEESEEEFEGELEEDVQAEESEAYGEPEEEFEDLEEDVQAEESEAYEEPEEEFEEDLEEGVQAEESEAYEEPEEEFEEDLEEDVQAEESEAYEEPEEEFEEELEEDVQAEESEAYEEPEEGESEDAPEEGIVEQETAEQEADDIVRNVTQQILPETPEEPIEITKKMPDLSVLHHDDPFRNGETMRIPDLALAEYEEEHRPVMHLPDELVSVFSYFVPVNGMEDQLCRALIELKQHMLEDETAYTGNLIIQGGHGCGKTVLATSIIKALQKETGYPSGRIGKIDSEALNQKNIQQLLRKVAGGCLIIENAGNMTRQTAVTLSLLLEQDASGLLVIMEDTSKGIKKALSLDEGYAKKFTAKVNVPIFTNDELVSFARSYSRELGYEIDEMAILALYNRISNIQRLDQATTLTEVKEIVDEAIERAQHGGIKKAFSFFASKRYTEDDKVILHEKDFED